MKLLSLHDKKTLEGMTFVSCYPSIYWKLKHADIHKIVFNDELISSFFVRLWDCKEVGEVYKLYINSLPEIFPDDNLSVGKIEDFARTFYAWDNATAQWAIDARKGFLQAAYNNKHRDNVLDNVHWRHDGWWNSYYGPVEDRAGYNELLKEYKKGNHEARVILTLAYRMLEFGEVKKARRLLFKARRKLRWRYLKEFWEVPIYLEKMSFFRKLIYVWDKSYMRWSRHKLNMDMFLYRTGSPKLINTILRQNKLHKHFFSTKRARELQGAYGAYDSTNYVRPQHIMRLIEVRIDKYCQKPDISLINEIHYLIMEILRELYSGYYTHEKIIINCFMIDELYFTLYYYLYHIYAIDISKEA